ncbi:MAG: helix-turn-helix domain-containing protein [Negativicutes bacterium]
MDSSSHSEPDYNAIGMRLKEVRGALSQTAFGEPIGYKYGYIRDCEHGKKPSFEYLFKVSDFYGVSLEWLLKGVASIDVGKQKAEAIFDPDLNEMIDLLTEMLESDQQHLRSWAILQFKNAYRDYSAMRDAQKKLHA